MCTIGLSFALSCSSSLLLCRLCPRRLFSLAPTAHWWEFSPSSSSSSLPLSIWYAELPNHFTHNNSVSNTSANNLISSKETVWSQMLLKIPIHHLLTRISIQHVWLSFVYRTHNLPNCPECCNLYNKNKWWPGLSNSKNVRKALEKCRVFILRWTIHLKE